MHRPNKKFGQHWLKNEGILQKIVLAANIQPNDRVLEIGPGQGHLTQKLLDSELELVHAIEIDKHLIYRLKNRFSKNSKFSLMEGDVLSVSLVPPDGLPANKVVANIPYNITGPILKRLIGKLGAYPEYKFQSLVLLLQKDVAQRILAVPGESCFSALSVRIQLMSRILPVCEVSPNCFEPPPKVQSQVVVIEPFEINQRLPLSIENNLESILKMAFSSRRKKLRNSLQGFRSIELLESIARDIDINLDLQPQDLSINDWLSLANFMSSVDDFN